MKKISFILLSLCFLTVTVSAQKGGPRTFDNFDRSQGVQVMIKPVVYIPKPTTKKLVRKTGKNRIAVVVSDPFAGKKKKTGWVVSVKDGMSQRENPVMASKLVMGSSPHLKGFTTGNPIHDSYIVASSQKYGIDPLLIYSQMHQESSFKVTATSHKGASGLMQLMPATARRFGVTRIYDPKQNIDAGVKYMRWLLDTFSGDVVLALAGYNAGEGAVMKYGGNVPPYRETKEYVRRITSRYYTISNPSYIQAARKNTTELAANLEQNRSRPLGIYEPSPLTMRTADGKMILVNQ